MKKILTILMCLTLPFMMMAQETKPLTEVGLSFSSLNNFGFTFKKGNNKSLWRFNALVISGSNYNESSDSLETNYKNQGYRLQIGKEFRKPLADNLNFIYGADISFQYSQYKNERDDLSTDNYDYLTNRTTYQPGINLVLGLSYLISEHFVISAELQPRVSYTIGKEVEERSYNDDEKIESDISGINYGLSNNSALITFAYRF